MLTAKRLSDLSAADVRAFVVAQPAESEHLELKETLPTRGGELDAWVRGEGRITDRARNELLAEVIAFANSHGGLVLLGVRESDDHPMRALDVAVVPRCADLAARLKLQARDCIEPPLPSIEIEGIPFDGDAGVVAIRVASSIRAPHRLTTTRECYVRRADRTEKMTMREIQELTLSRSTSLAAATGRFTALSSDFRAANSMRSGNFYAMRVSAVPLAGDLYIDRVFGNSAVRPVFGAFEGYIGPRRVTFSIPHEPHGARPLLRAAQYVTEHNEYGFAADVHCDGVVQYTLWYSVEGREEDGLFAEWIAAACMNTLLTAHKFRGAAGAPTQEYGFECEFQRVGGPLNFLPWGDSRPFVGPRAMHRNPLVLPRLSLGERDEIPALVGIVYRDSYNAAGFDTGEHVLLPTLPKPAA